MVSWDADGRIRIAGAVSKLYVGRGAMRCWYAFHQHHQEFLAEATDAYSLLACVGLDLAFAIPFQVLSRHLADLDGCALLDALDLEATADAAVTGLHAIVSQH